ncbi:MAG: hypothetical protein JW703_02225 [Candidatus Diapherotrites archaeon]|nr:hypothetical protein [Candidatus Diapherotrites archaeon]
MKTEMPIREKIQKIALECREAGASEWETAKIIHALNEEEYSQRKLRKKAIELLKKINPEAASIMESFTKMNVFTSIEWLEGFDRGNIIKSLLRETNVSRTVAEKIGFEVENKLKDLKVSHVTTAMIREMVAVKLLELGHEEIYSQYTRLGLPVFEAEKAAAKGKTSTQFVFRELNWLKKIPEKTRKHHFQGKLLLHFPQDYSSKVFGMTFTPETKESDKNNFMTNALIEFNKTNLFCSIPPAMNALNYVIAKYAEKNKKKTKELCINSLKQIQCNLMNIEKRFTPIISLDFYAGNALKELKEFKEKAVETGLMLNELTQSTSLKCVNRIDSEYKIKLFNEKSKALFLNCKSSELNPLTEFLACERKGVINFIELNLPFIALESEGKESVFNELLDELIDSFNQANEKKEELLKKTDYFKEKEFTEFSNILGLWGLKETEEITGLKGLKEKIKQKTGKKTIVTENNSVKANEKFIRAIEKEFHYNKKINLNSGEKALNQKEFMKKFSENEFISFEPQ